MIGRRTFFTYVGRRTSLKSPFPFLHAFHSVCLMLPLMRQGAGAGAKKRHIHRFSMCSHSSPFSSSPRRLHECFRVLWSRCRQRGLVPSASIFVVHEEGPHRRGTRGCFVCLFCCGWGFRARIDRTKIGGRAGRRAFKSKSRRIFTFFLNNEIGFFARLVLASAEFALLCF